MPAGKTYEPIAKTTLTSDELSVTFSSISSSYTDLVLVCGSLGMNAGGSAGRLRFNGDTGSNYSAIWFYGTGSTAGKDRDSNQTSMRVIGANQGPGTSNNDNYIIHIMAYSKTNINKPVVVRGNAPTNETYILTGLWRSTSAINSITLLSYNGTDKFKTGSTFTLYGIAAA
jgi:hypothetical protein